MFRLPALGRTPDLTWMGISRGADGRAVRQASADADATASRVLVHYLGDAAFQLLALR